MLHAWKLGFTNPSTGEWQKFEAPLPSDFRDARSLFDCSPAT